MSHMGQNVENMVDSPSLLIFWPKPPWQQVCHEQEHQHDVQSKHLQ